MILCVVDWDTILYVRRMQSFINLICHLVKFKILYIMAVFTCCVYAGAQHGLITDLSGCCYNLHVDVNK